MIKSGVCMLHAKANLLKNGCGSEIKDASPSTLKLFSNNVCPESLGEIDK